MKTSTSSSTTLMACAYPMECNTVQEIPHDIGYLDSGLKNHILTKQRDSKFIPDVYHVEDLKHNLLRIRYMIQKGYRVNIEDNHCVIKYKHPSNQLI